MAITSTSTITDVLAQYNNNLSWEGSVTKAQAALEAIRWLLVNRPQNATTNGRTINFTALEQEKKQLEQFVGKFSSSVNRAGFTRGRMLT